MKPLPTVAGNNNSRVTNERPRARLHALRFLPLALGLFVLWLTFRTIPLSEIRRILALVEAWQIAVVLMINIVFHALMGMRWWLLTRREVPGVRLLDMVFVRLGAFGVSYLTPGPQLGGEPLQILYLRRQHKASYARATATVIMDRLVELLAGLLLMPLALGALLHERLLQSVVALSPVAVILLALLMTWPAIHILLLWRGAYPVSKVLGNLAPSRRLKKIRQFLRAAEHLAGRFCQRRPSAVLAALGTSLLAAGLSVVEYALITSFLDMHLQPWQMLAGWTAGWLSFLVPLPGALGALEASQVIALGSFGISRAAALSATLLLRGRDLLFGGAGFLLATRQVQQAASTARPADAPR